MELPHDRFLFGDLLACTPAADWVRERRGERVRETARCERFRLKIQQILAAMKSQYPDLLKPSW